MEATGLTQKRNDGDVEQSTCRVGGEGGWIPNVLKAEPIGFSFRYEISHKTGCEQVKHDSKVPGEEEMALLATKTGQAARGAGWGQRVGAEEGGSKHLFLDMVTLKTAWIFKKKYQTGR